MRYYDHRHLILPAGVVEKLEYGFARLIVQSAGRFITQKQLRILSERSRYRDSLLLTAGPTAPPVSGFRPGREDLSRAA